MSSLLLVLLSFPGIGDRALGRYSFTEVHMGTRFRIILYAPSEESAKKAARAAFSRIAELDGIMSDYKPASELMQLCKKAGGPPVKLSDDLYKVLAAAQKLAEKTGGAFDVTVGPVVRQWRIARKGQRLPEREDLERALKLVGWKKLRLDHQKKTAQLLLAGMQLDLGGIAKGYTADEALKVLRSHGISRAMVAAGGDIVVGDPPPGEKGWSIGIAPVDDPNRPPARHVLLNNAAVSTAGDAEQYVQIDGKRYSHIVDPRSGMAILGQFSVTVIARRGLDADGLDTAIAVLGLERGLELVEAVDGAAMLYVRKDGEQISVKTSKRFAQYETSGR